MRAGVGPRRPWTTGTASTRRRGAPPRPSASSCCRPRRWPPAHPGTASATTTPPPQPPRRSPPRPPAPRRQNGHITDLKDHRLPAHPRQRALHSLPCGSGRPLWTTPGRAPSTASPDLARMWAGCTAGPHPGGLLPGLGQDRLRGPGRSPPVQVRQQRRRGVHRGRHRPSCGSVGPRCSRCWPPVTGTSGYGCSGTPAATTAGTSPASRSPAYCC